MRSVDFLDIESPKLECPVVAVSCHTQVASACLNVCFRYESGRRESQVWTGNLRPIAVVQVH